MSEAGHCGQAGRGGPRRPGVRKQDWIANQLRRVYDEALQEDIPDDMLALLAKLDEQRRRRTRESSFREDLVAAIPMLRGFARSLSGNRDRADDLVQETLAKAIANRDKYRPGHQPARLAGDDPAQPVLFRGPPALARGVGRGGHARGAADRRRRCTTARWRCGSSSGRCRCCRWTSARRWCWWARAGSPTRRRRRCSSTRVGTVKSRVSRARARLEMLLAGGEELRAGRRRGDEVGGAAPAGDVGVRGG